MNLLYILHKGVGEGSISIHVSARHTGVIQDRGRAGASVNEVSMISSVLNKRVSEAASVFRDVGVYGNDNFWFAHFPCPVPSIQECV